MNMASLENSEAHLLSKTHTVLLRLLTVAASTTETGPQVDKVGMPSTAILVLATDEVNDLGCTAPAPTAASDLIDGCISRVAHGNEFLHGEQNKLAPAVLLLCAMASVTSLSGIEVFGRLSSTNSKLALFPWLSHSPRVLERAAGGVPASDC